MEAKAENTAIEFYSNILDKVNYMADNIISDQIGRVAGFVINEGFNGLAMSLRSQIEKYNLGMDSDDYKQMTDGLLEKHLFYIFNDLMDAIGYDATDWSKLSGQGCLFKYDPIKYNWIIENLTKLSNLWGKKYYVETLNKYASPDMIRGEFLYYGKQYNLEKMPQRMLIELIWSLFSLKMFLPDAISTLKDAAKKAS